MEKDRRTSKIFGSRISSIFNPHTNPNASELKSLVQIGGGGSRVGGSVGNSAPPNPPNVNSNNGNSLARPAALNPMAEPTTPKRGSFHGGGTNNSNNQQRLSSSQTFALSLARVGVSPSPRPLSQPLLNSGGGAHNDNRYSQHSNVTSTSTHVSSDGSMSVLRPMVEIPDHLKPQFQSQPASPMKSPRLSRKPPPSMMFDEGLSPSSQLDSIQLLDSLAAPMLQDSRPSSGIPKSQGVTSGLEEIISSLENNFELLSPGEDNHEYQEDIDFIEDVDPLNIHHKVTSPISPKSISSPRNDFIREESESDSDSDSNYHDFSESSSTKQAQNPFVFATSGEELSSSNSRTNSSAPTTTTMENRSIAPPIGSVGTGGRGTIVGRNIDSPIYPHGSGSSSSVPLSHSHIQGPLGDNISSEMPYPMEASASPTSVVFPRTVSNDIHPDSAGVYNNEQPHQESQSSLLTSSSSLYSPISTANPVKPFPTGLKTVPSVNSNSTTSTFPKTRLDSAFQTIPRSNTVLTTNTSSTAVGAGPSGMGHKKSNSITSILSSSSYRNVNLQVLKKTLNLQPGEGERSNYVSNIRKAAGTSYNESQPGKWKLPIGILPIDKNANYGLSNGRYIRLAGGVSQGRSKKGSGVELKHGHLAPRLLAAEVDENDSTIPGLNSRLGRSGINNLQSPRFTQSFNNNNNNNNNHENVKSSNSSITAASTTLNSVVGNGGGFGLKRVATEGSLVVDSHSIVTGGDSSVSGRTKSISSASSGSISDAHVGYYQHPGYKYGEDEGEVDDDDEEKDINSYRGNRAGFEEDDYNDLAEEDMNGHLNGESNGMDNGYYDNDERPRLVLANPDYSDSD